MGSSGRSASSGTGTSAAKCNTSSMYVAILLNSVENILAVLTLISRRMCLGSVSVSSRFWSFSTLEDDFCRPFFRFSSLDDKRHAS